VVQKSTKTWGFANIFAASAFIFASSAHNGRSMGSEGWREKRGAACEDGTWQWGVVS